MANNYTQFSEMIPCETGEQQEWLMQELAVAVKGEERPDPVCEFEEEPPHPACEFEANDEGVWVCARESGDLDALADVVVAFQNVFGIEESWTLTWADTCSKPRVGEFGGGGLVVYRGKVSWLNTWSWCQAEIGRMRMEVET